MLYSIHVFLELDPDGKYVGGEEKEKPLPREAQQRGENFPSLRRHYPGQVRRV